MFCVISVFFNIRNTLPKFGTFLLGHPVYICLYCEVMLRSHHRYALKTVYLVGGLMVNDWWDASLWVGIGGGGVWGP